MRQIRTSGSEGGETAIKNDLPYPYCVLLAAYLRGSYPIKRIGRQAAANVVSDNVIAGGEHCRMIKKKNPPEARRPDTLPRPATRTADLAA